MTAWHLIGRNLRHYWRIHVGVVLGAAVSTAVLTGGLLLGDSVRFSLEAMALNRLGKTQLALQSHDRFVRSELANELSSTLGARVAPVLKLRGLLVEPESGKRSSSVQVLGVDERFWQLGVSPLSLTIDDNEIVLNEPLAQRLGVVAGDDVVLRVEKPQLLSPEAPLSLDNDTSVAHPMSVVAVVSEVEMGRFSLQVNQRAPLNAFVSLATMGEMVSQPQRSNMLLVGEGRTQEVTPKSAHEALKECFKLADAALEIRELPKQGQVELRSRCVFMDAESRRAAVRAAPNAVGVLSYFTAALSNRQHHTPYSIVTALGPLHPEAQVPTILPPDMESDGMMISQWLADDLKAQKGDLIRLRYFVMGPGRNLEQRDAEFRVHGITPMEGPAVDSEWMPQFPGLSEKTSCREWDAGMDIQWSEIRPKDEAYWTKYRGTPKAFLTLEAGQAIWSNRFGELTAIRWPLQQGAKHKIEQNLLRELDLPSVGLFFHPVRDQARKAINRAQDFGPLFLGLSFFLIAAALVLMGLLFALGVEQRTRDTGILLALGFTWKTVCKVLLLEGVALAAMGGLLGVVASVVYSRMMIYGLGTLWRGAVAGSPVLYHGEIFTLALGWGISVCMAVLSMWIVLRRHVRRQIRDLLEETGDVEPLIEKDGGRIGFVVASIAVALAAVVLIASLVRETDSGVGAFFLAGVLLLTAGLSSIYGILYRRAAVTQETSISISGFGLRNASRKRGRSLGVVTVLACASFLIFSVGANLKDPLEHSDRVGSGTGGFAFIGETALPILHDLNQVSGQRALGLDERTMQNVEIIQLRVREGGDASCLNLNRVERPRVLGVSPEAFETRGAFTFADILDGYNENSWSILNEPLPDGRIPVVADQATITWGLGKKIGDTIEYVDKKGQIVEFQLVGALKNSIFQGTVIVAEDRFTQCFPAEYGYRMLLVDTIPEHGDKVLASLEKAGRNWGLELTPAVKRLSEFYAVEKTYLSIFLMLGGLGMMLGCVGLGCVVLRNVMERRSELAVLQAVGYTRFSLYLLLLFEHGWLLALGMACGVVAAGVAVVPALRTLGFDLPWVSLGLTLSAIIASGMVWIWMAAKLAMGRSFLDALRNE